MQVMPLTDIRARILQCNEVNILTISQSIKYLISLYMYADDISYISEYTTDDFRLHANRLDPYQTAPKGAV